MEYTVMFGVDSKVNYSSCKKIPINLDKFPGFYDNLIAGGQPIELSIEQNFLRKHLKKLG